MMDLHEYEGRYLPSQGATCFLSLDGSDVYAWMVSQGLEACSHRDLGTHGAAFTKDGFKVSTSTYVSHTARPQARSANTARALFNKATVKDARVWNEADEQWIYCMDYLRLIEAVDGADFCEFWVCKLEEHFEAMLAA